MKLPFCFSKLFNLIILLGLFQTIYTQTPKVKIGLLMSDLKLERWSKDRDYFLSKSKELNYETFVGDAMNSQLRQNMLADSMVKLGVKVLVVIPVDGNLAANIVENAHKNNVKVVAYDRLIMNSDLDAYVSYDNEMVGQVMALYSTIIFKKGTIAYIGGPKTDMNSFAIRKGLMQILTPYIIDKSMTLECDTFASAWSSEEAKKIFKEFVSKHKCPDAIFTGSDELARGVIEILDETGLSGKVIVTGQDAELQACRNLVLGKQTLTLFKPVRLLADRAALIASGLIGDIPFLTITEVNNGKINVPSLILNPVPVDKNNLKTTVIKEGYHTEMEIYENATK
jgi:D-xylose transport system substrate-binding protein